MKTLGLPVARAKALTTRWIAIYPGTDAAMMMAVLHVLLTQRLVDRDFTEKYSYGFDELEKRVLGETDGVPKTPQWAERVCGTPAQTIREFAQLYGTVHPAALIPGLSIQRTMGGEEAIRMSIALQVATGNLGVLGGSSGGLTWGRLPKPRIGSITVPPNPIKASIPQYLWADAILHGKEGGFSSDIKAIYNVGGNFLSQGSDIRKNIRAFEKVEFSVCHDRFMTPTAGYCDVVLPTTTYLERNDIVVPAGGNYLLYSTQAVPPIPEARNDYDIFCGLAERLGFLHLYSEDRDEEAWLRSLLEASEVENIVEFRNTGIYWGRDQFRVGLSEFVSDPAGSPLKTPSGKVQIFSQAYAQTGYSPTPDYRPQQLGDEYPLRLVTPKSRYRIHSQNWNIPWFRGLENHALWIHPLDAKARSIEDGDVVRVYSPEGSMGIKTVVTDDIMPGVVCLLEGAWPEFDTKGVEVVGSVNILTSTVPTRPSMSSRTHTVSVQVAKNPRAGSGIVTNAGVGRAFSLQGR